MEPMSYWNRTPEEQDESKKGIGALLGKTLTRVKNFSDECLVMDTTDGWRYLLHHEQDCCESVRIEDVCGDLEDLVGSPILQAEEVSSDPPPIEGYQPESCTWTFYKLATIKGHVTLRWLGESNGYYSTGVDFAAERVEVVNPLGKNSEIAE